MEKDLTTRYVAIVEVCAMTEVALRHILINESSKNIFVIQNPVKQLNEGKLKLDKNWVVEFTAGAGQWEQLLEVQN